MKLTDEFIRAAIVDRCSSEVASNAHKIMGKAGEVSSKTGRDRMRAALELLKVVERTHELTLAMIATIDDEHGTNNQRPEA